MGGSPKSSRLGTSTPYAVIIASLASGRRRDSADIGSVESHGRPRTRHEMPDLRTTKPAWREAVPGLQSRAQTRLRRYRHPAAARRGRRDEGGGRSAAAVQAEPVGAGRRAPRREDGAGGASPVQDHNRISAASRWPMADRRWRDRHSRGRSRDRLRWPLVGRQQIRHVDRGSERTPGCSGQPRGGIDRPLFGARCDRGRRGRACARG